MLAYSASNDEADELRRLTILGRAGPPEHLEWIGQWGIFDALRASGDVVRVAERPELGLRPRLAVGIHLPPTDARRPPGFAGTIWLQQGSAPLADDVEEILRGGAVLAARIMSRLAAAPSTHTRASAGTARADGEDREQRHRRDRPRAGHRRRRARRVDRLRRRRALSACRRDCVERQRLSSRRPGRVDGRAGVRAAAQDRRVVVGDVVGARRGRARCAANSA